MIVEHNQSTYNGGQYDNAYKFNGKELDDATQMYYYGARYYDPRISIFVSVDPLVEKTFEPYSYVGNNPINFVDPTGQYKLSAYIQKHYPKFSAYIKHQVEKDVMGSKVILDAFLKNSEGNLTKDEVEKAVKWNSGPEIVLVQLTANGYYDAKEKKIYLQEDRIKFLESVLNSNESNDYKTRVLSAVFMTLTHETTHYGDYLDGLRQDGGEPGIDFENDVWFFKSYGPDKDGNDQFWQYFGDDKDKYNPEHMKIIFEEKMKTEEGRKTLPNLPD